MTYTVDANVVMSCLISGNPKYLTFFTENACLLPDFGMTELSKYQHVILKKSKLTPDKFTHFALSIFKLITVVPNMLISTSQYYDAYLICRDIDEDDTVYVALTLALTNTLLTRDRPLVDGLRAKGFLNVILLDELMNQNQT